MARRPDAVADFPQHGGFAGACAAPQDGHRIARGQGGPNTASNALDACRICHSWCHSRPDEAKDLGLMLKPGQDPTVEPVAYQNAGHVRLDDGGGIWPA